MGFPDCHSRRPLPAEDGAFWCAHPFVHTPGQRVHDGICRACGRWREPPPEGFRPAPPPAAEPRRPCLHLGPAVGTRDCPTCRGTVRLKVFACAHPAHREATLPDCALCPDHAERPPGKAGEGPTPAEGAE